MGIRASDAVATTRAVTASADDRSALLVEFLNELIFLIDAEGVGISGIQVRRLSDIDLEAEVRTVALDVPPEGVVVKAATYHQVGVERLPDGRTEVRVYLDV